MWGNPEAGTLESELILQLAKTIDKADDAGKICRPDSWDELLLSGPMMATHIACGKGASVWR